MTLRPRDKAALGVVVGVVAIIAAYLLVLAPMNHKASSLNAEIATQQSTLVQDENTYQAGKAAEAALREDGSQWTALGRAVPGTANIPALLRVLQRDSNAAHVHVTAITLSGSSSSSASTAPTTSASGTSSADGESTVPISLTFTGGYQALDRLITTLDNLVTVAGDRVQASGPLLSISAISLTGSGSKLTADISASIYQLAATSTAAASSTGETS